MIELDEQILQATILIVDDQPANVKLLDKLLRSAGFTHIMTTTDPRESLELYQQHRPDLVLLDIRMPHLNGYEVMARLQEIEGNPYIPVLVLTAQTDHETRMQALSSGAKDFLSKPFDRVEALSRIRNMLEVRLLHNRITQQNQLLEERVRLRTEALHNTRLDIIRRLGRASEYRDNETGLHIIRMSRYAEAIGRAAHLDPDTCETLLNASPMHDLGKIGIPDHILRKPGKLDPEEWFTMQKHAEIGAELLSGSDFPLLDAAQRIALTHHEKWDGSGYPNRLAGTAIPLIGRIVALADVFDALTSHRPYKKAWSVDEALAEIQQQTGRQFDPELTHIFLGIVPELITILTTFAEPGPLPCPE